MTFVISALIIVSLIITAGILFVIWKFTHHILEQRKIKLAKEIATVVAISALVLIILWFGPSL